ncbi:NAD(+) diphosphatase [Micromonospora sp. NPDC049559]|uniref:NAD(+) diphosphatase n=1 Tax=Micromonospora sp. NPDC049559 TaxID=3155923 RepID=UPI0034384FE8
MSGDEDTITYGGGWLDRAGGLRADPDWLAGQLSSPRLRLVPVWRDQCLVVGEPANPVELTGDPAAGLLAEVGVEPVLLGLDGAVPYFAVDLSALPDERARRLAGADATMDVRALVGRLTPAGAALHAYARGILYWHRGQRFCGTCGAGTVSRDGGHQRACPAPSCGRLFFPRIEPAVIVLVEAPGTPHRCLLARHRGAPEGSYSTLAGFLEIGESLEDAVRREMAEEAGVRLSSVEYQASQPWPFPAGLMVGFRAVADSDEIRVDGDELVEARWFTRDELLAREAAGRRLARPDSIGRYLIRSWLDRAAVRELGANGHPASTPDRTGGRR